MSCFRAASFLPLVVLCATSSVFAQYSEWRHRGTLAIRTTPDGANLPAAARETNFPLLVRLDRQTFDFRQARPDGADLRFSADGRPLAYQIEHWDAERGAAAIWVRVPEIRGDARQTITLHWGRPDASSESDGKGVFDASNGHSAVLHLTETAGTLRDEVGATRPTDAGTTDGQGVIGRGRRFVAGRGIACGEMLAGLPTGRGPNSTEVWFRAEAVNNVVVGWGNEQAQGKVTMLVQSPPHVRMDCYFSTADVSGRSRLPLGEWVHVAHTYSSGEAKVYVNGRLDEHVKHGSGTLDIRSPARMWIGGWYGQYRFVGDVDEVRVSNVARSADWIKLSYENQKPNQTLVGTLPQAGDELFVTPSTVLLDEGRRATLTARAGGAEKVVWLLQRGDQETVLATDRFSIDLDAGRVVGNETWRVRLRAIYADRVEVREVPVTIRNVIPEPEFTLAAPAAWNGRDAIEVVPRVTNHAALDAAGVGPLRYRWTVNDGAVLKQEQADRLLLRRAQCSGRIEVSLQLDNGGAPTRQSTKIMVQEPQADPWIERTPGEDEKPEPGQFYARDERHEGTLHYRGQLDAPADAVILRVFADDRPFRTETQTPGADRRYALSVKLRSGLVQYRVEFAVRRGAEETVIDRVGDLVCGDVLLIDGQSNALATDTHEDSPRETHPWIRSYGGPTGRGDGAAWLRDRQREAERAGLRRPNLWCRPVWKAKGPEHVAELGWWGMELAKRLVDAQKVPVCVINAAIGGSRIDEHLPKPNDHENLSTMYGRMLWRVRQARLTHGIRAVLWHQGENDQGADGPTGKYGWETYQQFFVDMSAGWKEDLPNVRRYYVFQIWPNACAMGGRHGSGDRLREAQRTLPRLYSNLSVLSTVGVQPPGGCHFPLAGWARFAELVQPLLERDLHGRSFAAPVTPPNLIRARWTSDARDALRLEFDQPIVWRDVLAREFYLDDRAGEVAAGEADGAALTLRLKRPGDAARITYLRERDWSQERLLLGTNGQAALTFCDVPIER